MNKFHYFILLLLFAVTPAFAEDSFYDLEARLLNGKKISFNQFRDKVVLVTNISLKCGTTPQLGALQELYSKYKDRGLEILAFPSNDFTGDLEPKDPKKIREICDLKYGVKFPVFQLGKVRGKSRHDVFRFVTMSGPEEMQGEIAFNLEKFLIDKRGMVRNRYGSFTPATSSVLREDLEGLLSEKAIG